MEGRGYRQDLMTARPGEAVSRGAVPPLLVQVQGSVRTLQAGPVYWIGRDPAGDIVVGEPLSSWRHAILMVADGRWVLEDVGSANGTFAGGQQVMRVEIIRSCQVQLGCPHTGLAVSCSVTEAPDPVRPAVWPDQEAAARWPAAVMLLPARVLRIGRAAALAWWRLHRTTPGRR
jgi:ABC transport system ATP-binding/permease protein